MNTDWKFHKGQIESGYSPNLDDSEFFPILQFSPTSLFICIFSLPHSAFSV